ncbi:MAG TPA: prepilin peptidase, partial [Bacillaceae bacterium]|nr:A24 family peptidase [Paenibacillus bovis]HLU23489.1 prepilin peptidase [Bacillaceae bacterium]
MTILFFLYGLLFGSFYNVVGLRVPKKQSIIRPRSACPSCGRTLSFLELMPVVAYVIQLGKCKHCGKRISPIYPIMELTTGLLFALAYIKIGWSFELVIALTLISLLVIITVSDLTYMLIPDKVLLVFTGIFIIELIIEPLSPWWDSLAGAAVAFIMLLAIAIISKGGMGGGDIKLFTVLGLVLGVKLVFVSFFFANLIGAIIGIIGMAIGKIERKKPIPFGPFIAIGTIIAYFFHKEIFTWYLSLVNF